MGKRSKEEKSGKQKNRAAVALGKLGGLKRASKLTAEQRREIAGQGGRARAVELTPAQRKAIAAGAAKARWDAEK